MTVQVGDWVKYKTFHGAVFIREVTQLDETDHWFYMGRWSCSRKNILEVRPPVKEQQL